MTADKGTAYRALSQETVKALHARFQNSLEQKARKALPDAADAPALVEALKALQVEATRKGISLKANEMAVLAAAGLETVNDAKEKMEQRVHVRTPASSHFPSPCFTARQKQQISAAAEKRRDAACVEAVFDGRDRIYLQLQDRTDVTEAQKKIAAYLETKGYGITDYNKGYATDAAGKQTFKIGRLLKDREELYRLFVDDASRGLGNLVFVLSRNPMDIARMSTGRAWGSCMGSGRLWSPYLGVGGFNWRFVPRDVEKGTMVAYLISEKDPDILNPLARILLKPFAERQDASLATLARRIFRRENAAAGDTARKIFMPYTPYGLHNPAFIAAVKDFAEKNFNAGKTGGFELVSGLYADRKSRRITRQAPAV